MRTAAFSIIALTGFILLFSCKNEVKDTEDNQTVVTDTIPKVEAPESLYVTAVSGLTMREQPNIESAKLIVMPQGTKVKVINAEGKTTMNVGGIDGTMDEIEYNNQKGFAFNGFLSKFPPPPANAVVKNYVNDLKNDFPTVGYSEVTGGTASKPTKTQTLILPTEKWHEAFFMAQQLFEIPRQFAFPNPKGSNSETQWAQNNAKDERGGELKISRTNNTLDTIEYRYRKGKFLNSITITEENNLMKIEKTEQFQ